MKGLIILADCFEDVEAIATIDILRRGNINIDVVSLFNNEVSTSSNLKLINDLTINDVDYKSYDFLILPGGKATFKYLNESKLIEEIISYFYLNHKLIAAICAAPMLIGKLGYLNKYTVFPGCDDIIISGTNTHDTVCYDNNIITARSMYYSQDFALKIIEVLLGIDAKNQIEKQIKGL